ncbi:hypothetical protein NBC122_00312 [Chryseobacterium salivictor]|uniref:Uncharacterized protein n=1 Tax=Chryseobacterium salivictor TaxID=2547600 RepID=A0A4P6ZCE0_9FLAO|nr:hypothetical protein NBC122_00312 [Chryseobacterium salivictor]
MMDFFLVKHKGLKALKLNKGALFIKEMQFFEV